VKHQIPDPYLLLTGVTLLPQTLEQLSIKTPFLHVLSLSEYRLGGLIVSWLSRVNCFYKLYVIQSYGLLNKIFY